MGGSRAESRRVKTARGRKAGSTRWLQRQLNDPYVQEAQRLGYRSRAAFKLLQIDEKFGLLRRGGRVIDLGAAPGGWCQVAAAGVGARGVVVGVDLLDVEALAGVEFLTLDFMDDDAPAAIVSAVGGAGVDLVLSDLAAPAVGHRATDHLRTLALAEAAAAFAAEVLRPGGGFVVKVLQGADEPSLFKDLAAGFETVQRFKPAASRGESTELYHVATGFRGAP